MRSFIRKLFSKSPVQKVDNEVNTAIKNLLSIKPEFFKYVHSSDLSIFKLNVLFSNIQELNKRLTIYNECLKTNIVIKTMDIPTFITEMSICNFFISSKNHFIDEIKEMNEFKLLCFEFLNLYTVGLNDINDNFVKEHNVRILSPVVKNLLIVIECFSKINSNK